MLKVLTAFFFYSFCLNAEAQSRMKEMFNLGYIWNPNGNFSAVDGKFSTAYYKNPFAEFSASLSVREADLLTNRLSSNEEIHLKNYKLSLPVSLRTRSGWMYTAAPSASVRNASHTFVLNDDSLYFSFFGLALYRRPGPETRWTWGFGFIYSKEIEEHFFLPIVSATYFKAPILLNLGFPHFGIMYKPTENWELGIKANYDSTTHTLAKGDPIGRGVNPGLKVRVIDVGPAFNFRVHDGLWVNSNLGVVALAEAQTVTSGGTARDMIYKGDSSIFLRVSLSYYPTLK